MLHSLWLFSVAGVASESFTGTAVGANVTPTHCQAQTQHKAPLSRLQ